MSTALKRKQDTAPAGGPGTRVAAMDWARVATDLEASGVARLEPLLTARSARRSPGSTTTSAASAAPW
jgi:hypothetical protein